MKKLGILLVITVVVIFNSCKEGITDPIEPEAGRRDYVWTLDTISKSTGYFSTGMWGVSEDDFWLVGAQGSEIGEELQHYDGTKFTRTFSVENIGGIFGLNNNKIFAATNSGRVLLFNGTSWKEDFALPTSYEYDEVFASVHGTEKYDIYVCGRHSQYAKTVKQVDKNFGIIYKYNGLEWEKLFEYPDSWFNKILKYDNRIYVYSARNPKSGWHDNYISEFKNNTLIDIIFDTTGQFTCNMNLINSELFINKENEIYRMKNGRLNEFINLNNYGIDFSNTRFMGEMWGRSKNDLFFKMGGGIMHYDGTDIKYVYKLENRFAIAVAGLVFEKSAVFVIEDVINNQMLLLKGILKE
ncbi:MAG: hypothetical protein M0P71_14640 [Melioribacteraceae bacterium]|nr:hypothetical protein [Melioribacteraceae bacterium]